MNSFNRNLRIQMEENGLTQEDLAKELGVSRATIGCWLRNDVVPRKTALIKLSKYFNAPEDFFYKPDSLENKRSSGFSEKLIYLMVKHNLTQKALAKHLNVAETAVSKWIKKGAFPRFETMIELASLFGVTAQFLANDTETIKEESAEISIMSKQADIENKDKRKKHRLHNDDNVVFNPTILIDEIELRKKNSQTEEQIISAMLTSLQFSINSDLFEIETIAKGFITEGYSLSKKEVENGHNFTATFLDNIKKKTEILLNLSKKSSLQEMETLLKRCAILSV